MNIIRRNLILGAITAAGIFKLNPANSSTRTPTDTKYIFAHYMVCCPRYGLNATINQFMEEILTAQTSSIDGFALNCGGWSKEPKYPELCNLIFAAAKKLNSGFKLFFSADTTTGLTANEIFEMIQAYKDHPNYFRTNSKPVISSYSSSDTWSKELAAKLLAAKIKALLIPYFSYGVEPTPEAAARVFNLTKWADGFFYFGAAGSGKKISDTNRTFAKAWLSADKIFMASVTPFYRGRGQNNRIFETHGFEAMASEWVAAIENKSTWVEIVTWNDWGERSYVAPFGDAASTTLWQKHWGPLLAHQTYLEASTYYIKWFKTGSPPKIPQDILCYFYRLHPKYSKTGPQKFRVESLPKGVETLVDATYVTVFLTAAATLIISVGPEILKVHLPEGVHHIRGPFASGTPIFTLTRQNKIVIKKRGEWPIDDKKWSDYNYFSGNAVAKNI